MLADMNPALLGLVAGHGAGVFEYAIATRLIKRAMAREMSLSGGVSESINPRQWRMMHWTLIAGSFLFLPAAGFMVGSMFTGQ